MHSNMERSKKTLRQAELDEFYTPTEDELNFANKAIIAVGTHYELYENNLLGERHIRHGGIAYHSISEPYVALFSHFIA